jgi:hypothetical protein
VAEPGAPQVDPAPVGALAVSGSFFEDSVVRPAVAKVFAGRLDEPQLERLETSPATSDAWFESVVVHVFGSHLVEGSRARFAEDWKFTRALGSADWSLASIDGR